MIKAWKEPYIFSKQEGEEEKENHSSPFLGVITGGNGSHLSHLDIWEDLWLHRSEGRAEVSKEKALHRGRQHDSNDALSLQQWEVKGKNNRAARGREDVALQEAGPLQLDHINNNI